MNRSTPLTRTPDEVSAELASRCDELVPGGRPVLIPRHPEPGARKYRCVFNARACVEARGGAVVLGWDISVWEGVLAHFVGHAVVRAGEELRCVTPSKYGESRCLFLPDPGLHFDFGDPSARLPSLKVPLCADPDLIRFIELDRAEAEIRLKYSARSGAVQVIPADVASFQSVNREKKALLEKLIYAHTRF